LLRIALQREANVATETQVVIQNNDALGVRSSSEPIRAQSPDSKGQLMLSPTAPTLKSDPERLAFEADILSGLAHTQKSIPCKYFYDAVGSELFEQITTLDEYYPTRSEIEILTHHASNIATRTLNNTALVEFGSGSSIKTELLLAACPAITRYLPIDVSETSLTAAKLRLERMFPGLRVEPMLADFTAAISLPTDIGTLPKLGFFPGSTIGNFSHDAAVALLGRFRTVLGSHSRLIVGADLRKSSDILVRAYDDAAGVTAAFNLNLLTRINNELHGTFDLTQFRHLATYDEATGRIDMYLVSAIQQSVRVCGQTFEFKSGERIHTEVSQKYHVAEFQTLAQRAGWHVATHWTDSKNYFSVHEFHC
jgi:dimethylhistidine N-methyltransferase